jgi:hypothetical protein
MTNGDAMNHYATFRAHNRIARPASFGAVVTILALVAGCSSEPSAPPDPVEAAAILRDGERMLTPPASTAGNRTGIASRPSTMAATDTGGQQEDRR